MAKCRLRAKGEKVVFDTEDGKKEYLIRPLRNEQLLEIQELWDKKEDSKAQAKANTLFVMYSLNRDDKIVNGSEESFGEEEVKDMETPFLLDIMETAARVNDMEKAVSFQKRTQEGLAGVPLKSSAKDTLEYLQSNPKRTL